VSVRIRSSLSIAAVFGIIVAMLGLAWNALMVQSDGTGTAGRFYRVCAIISTPLDLLLLAASIRQTGAPTEGIT
jgi:hypothetical protein